MNGIVHYLNILLHNKTELFLQYQYILIYVVEDHIEGNEVIKQK